MKHFRHCIAAIRFLTIFPVPGTFGTASEDLQGALPYFGLVGILLGIISGMAAWFLWIVFPPLVAAVLLTAVLLSFSGAMHLDGLADCADGFFSARKREQILEIMRDSRVGVMGVVALIMILLIKISVLGQMHVQLAVQTALLMPLAGRTALVLMMYLLPYVRKEGGMGTMFYSARTALALLVSLLFFVPPFLLVFGASGMVMVMVIFVVTFIFSRFCQRKVGGATGDTLGAACEISEATVPLSVILLFSS